MCASNNDLMQNQVSLAKKLYLVASFALTLSSCKSFHRENQTVPYLVALGAYRKNCTFLLHCIKQNHTSKLTMQTPDLFPSHANLHRRQHWIARNICYRSLLPLLPGALNNSLNGFSNFVTHIGFQGLVAALLSVAAISAAGLGMENKSLPRIACPIK